MDRRVRQETGETGDIGGETKDKSRETGDGGMKNGTGDTGQR